MAGRRVGFTEEQARVAIAESKSWTEALRRLGYCPSGGNPTTLKKYAAFWGIPTDHFDPYRRVMARLRKPKIPLEEILVEHSTYSRGNLKQRLYEAGLKQPLCAATLDTHCGRSIESPPPLRNCARCGEMFRAKHRTQRFCSRYCGMRRERGPRRSDRGAPCPETRRVERPPYERLLEEIEATSYSAVGRKYGVSDNAVRKWVRFYERQIEREALDAESEAARG